MAALAVAVLVAGSCGQGKHPSSSGTTATTAPGTTVTPSPAAEPLTASVAVAPDQGVAGTPFTFTVAIRGPGTGNAEGVTFGDGATSGANAGVVHCGDTARADRDSIYRHTYASAGTYTFVDNIYVIGPPPSCRNEHVTATTSLVVAAPLSTATLNGAFLSPTRNIGCYIDPSGAGRVRCATFSPPQLVTMDAKGTFQTCAGGTCDLGNPAGETPVLPYGSATGGGPFQCLSTRSGMTCTVVGHHGFTLSAVGVRPLTSPR